ncbi:unnamed protein product, partial [marine sediment metagenome]
EATLMTYRGSELEADDCLGLNRLARTAQALFISSSLSSASSFKLII